MRSNVVRCDLCKVEVPVNTGNLHEKDVWVEHDLYVKELVTLTFMSCPVCGRDTIVQVDNSETKALLSEVKSLYIRCSKFTAMNKPVPAKLACKKDKADTKLSRARANLAQRLDGALYQLEGDTIQLDYRYHAR